MDKKIRLNLGCGRRKIDGWINIDVREEVTPDLVLDIENAGLPFEDSSVSEIRAFDFLEHVHQDMVVFVMEEIWRVLEPGGKFEHFTPSTDGRGAFQDPYHVSYWNANSWLYWCNAEYRALYNTKVCFDGTQKEVVTDPQYRIIHTHGVLYAIKPAEAADAQ